MHACRVVLLLCMSYHACEQHKTSLLRASSCNQPSHNAWGICMAIESCSVTADVQSAGSSLGGYPAQANQQFPANSSTYQPQTYGGPQQRGLTSQPEQAADPFDQLPYPSLGLTRPTKPQRAPAPPLASLGANRQQLPTQQGQPSMQSAAAPQQVQQGQASSSTFGGNIWAQPEASQKEPAGATFEFGESAFNAPQMERPQQEEDRPREVPRPKQLYINSLYNADDGAADGQLPPGFDPSQQVSQPMP